MTRQRGSVRGLHYQRPPHAEMKLVSCLRGEVWDVAVDLRAGSPNLFALARRGACAEDNACALLIPAPALRTAFRRWPTMRSCCIMHSAAYAPGCRSGPEPARPAAWHCPGRCPWPKCLSATAAMRC